MSVKPILLHPAVLERFTFGTAPDGFLQGQLDLKVLAGSRELVESQDLAV
jgi:hypothetical protein